jgi:hypothetical protein
MLIAATFALTACADIDPTENELVLTIENRLSTSATVMYCKDASCSTTWWTDLIRADGESRDSVDAAPGTESTFVVLAGRRKRCAELAFRVRGPRMLVLAPASLTPC